MTVGPMPAAVDPSRSDRVLRRMLGSMSVFTMLMTIPQVLTIWVGQQAAGVSILSWSVYFASRFFGFGSAYRSETRTSTCLAWVGSYSTLVSLRE